LQEGKNTEINRNGFRMDEGVKKNGLNMAPKKTTFSSNWTVSFEHRRKGSPTWPIVGKKTNGMETQVDELSDARETRGEMHEASLSSERRFVL